MQAPRVDRYSSPRRGNPSPLGGLLGERRLVTSVDGEDPAELGGPPGRRRAPPGVQGGVLQPLRVRVAALAEQVPHLGLGDLRARSEPEVTEPGTEPAAR